MGVPSSPVVLAETAVVLVLPSWAWLQREPALHWVALCETLLLFQHLLVHLLNAL